MERQTSSIWKVGLFLAVGLALTAVIFFAIGDWRVLRSGYEIRVLFDSASGLLVGAPVKYAGVEVGEVRRIRIAYVGADGRPQAEVTLWLPAGVKVRVDDQVWIGMLGLLGEKYVEITPGPGEGRPLKPRETFAGAGAISELQIAQQLTHVLLDAQKTIDRVNAAVDEAQLSGQIEKTLRRAERLTQRLDEMAERVEAVLGEWQAVGERSNALLEDTRRWAPYVMLGAALAAVALMLR
jgi:phospholipid/cholesterol/gamma-HCH transport system substrate-binding protein